MLDLREIIKGNKEDYVIVMLGDTSPVIQTEEGTVIFKDNDFKKSVDNGAWKNSFLEENHNSFYATQGLFNKMSDKEKQEIKNKYSIGEPVYTFENIDGFIDLSGKKIQPKKLNDNNVFYGVFKLNDNGKEAIAKNRGKKIKTSSYFTYSTDEGEEARNHGATNDNVVIGKDIQPISISLLTNGKEPNIKIKEDYCRGVSLNEKKNIDKYIFLLSSYIDINMSDENIIKEEIDGKALFEKLEVLQRGHEEIKEALKSLSEALAKSVNQAKDEEVKEDIENSKNEETKEETKNAKNEETKEEVENSKNEEVKEETKEEVDNSKNSKNSVNCERKVFSYSISENGKWF